MRSFLIAVRFLTRLPVPESRPASGGDMPRAAVFFPLVGGLIGLLTASVAIAGAQIWPLWLAVVLALIFEALLTGALHEDAVADFFDAFGGGWSREDVLRILKDSRLGSYGALALFFFVTLRAGAMVSLGDTPSPKTVVHNSFLAAMVASAGLGRWMSVWLMATLPAVSDRPGLGSEVSRGLSTFHLLTSALWTLPALGWLFWLKPPHTLGALVALLILAQAFRALLNRRIGGTTGDCLGCLCYLAQVTVLLAVAATGNSSP